MDLTIPQGPRNRKAWPGLGRATARSVGSRVRTLPATQRPKEEIKASTARFRENDAVRLIDQPLQPSDRPPIPSNLQTLESITSWKALRSLMDWGGLTVEDGFDHPTRPEE
ncbi:hypothetical protein F2Q69_00013711 [Brassica cretica]|uniref:Uncharacterized protein n=1 Tax=Brassica cretica TaxID=69181 RepID=A0A8S9QMP7_BRACR|nr:hypothetical protein F2Q69_00013711 [Brassica cretica]